MSMSYTIIRPSEGKVFANADETMFYTALILAPTDSIENYHEVDIANIPTPEPEPEPDPEDYDPVIPMVEEDEEQVAPMTRAELTAAVAALEEQNAMLIGMLLENREDGMRASKAYSVGDLIVVDGKLYKAVKRIASGATLTVGTNVVLTTVAAEIAAANS